MEQEHHVLFCPLLKQPNRMVLLLTAVCVMDEWPSEESMMKLAMENNLSETVFIVKEDAWQFLTLRFVYKNLSFGAKGEIQMSETKE